jgi:cyclic nucleotide-binding protein
MFGRWRIHGMRFKGDWRAKLLALAQLLIGFVALLGVVALWTQDPIFMFLFAFVQMLLPVGIALFGIVAIFSQRTMVLESFGPGEIIFREGDPGRYVYVVKSGTVQIERERPGSAEPIILKELSSGDHFGEMALLTQAPRNATVRAVSPVLVYQMSPGHFTTLYSSLPGLREHVNSLMQNRIRELERRDDDLAGDMFRELWPQPWREARLEEQDDPPPKPRL